jgi:hypothetical protein
MAVGVERLRLGVNLPTIYLDTQLEVFDHHVQPILLGGSQFNPKPRRPPLITASEQRVQCQPLGGDTPPSLAVTTSRRAAIEPLPDPKRASARSSDQTEVPRWSAASRMVAAHARRRSGLSVDVDQIRTCGLAFRRPVAGWKCPLSEHIQPLGRPGPGRRCQVTRVRGSVSETRKSTSAVTTVPAVRPGAVSSAQ